jgi:Cep192 domain 4
MTRYRRPGRWRWITSVMLGTLSGLSAAFCPPAAYAIPVIHVPRFVSFTDVVKGETEAKTITIGNTGNTNLRVTSIVLTSGSSTSFALPFVTTLPLDIPSGESKSAFTVQFSPTGFDPATGSVVITSNDPKTPQVTVSLSGNGPCDTSEAQGVQACGEGTVPKNVKLRTSQITVEVQFVDCLIDFVPNQLNGAGQNTHTVSIWDCTHTADDGTVTLVRLADISTVTNTFRINKCGTNQDCVNARNVVSFQTEGIVPMTVQVTQNQDQEVIELTYLENNEDLNGNNIIEKGEEGLFPKVCLDSSGQPSDSQQAAGIIGHVALGHFTGAIIRGADNVQCHP